jgi:hypothetical protein
MTKANAPATGDFSVGTLVNSRYRVVAVIGRGGLATVYQAEDESLGRAVALKVISGTLGDADDARRHEDEVRLIAGFDHPGLVTLFDFVAIDGGPRAMLVMQFVDGTNLASRIAKGALGPELTADIGADVAAALAHIHSRGVMHRDVKPANILLPASGSGSGTQSALLADFGIARLVDDTGITSTGMIVGTASYLSPEQARGASLGPSTDIYSLGLVLLECLTATRAFPGSAVESVAARLSSDPVIPESLDPAWAELLRSMLAREPADRPEAIEVERRVREIAGAASGGPTLLMPAAGAAAAAATERLVPMAATERLASAAPAAARAPRPQRDPRRPFPLAGVLIGAGILVGAVLLFVLLLQLRPAGTGETAGPPSNTPSATVDEAPVAVVYPAVAGDLGSRLTELQNSVASLGSETATEDLQARVLSVSQLSANGDYEGALSALDELGNAVDQAELTSAEREQILSTADGVRSTLEGLIDQKGNGKDKKH